MAVYHPHTVSCACGNVLTVQLADSINVKRSPEARERILNGTMHRASCPKCKRAMTVEKPFYYTDFTRNALFKVFPRGERHTWKKASKDLDVASSFIPSGIVSSEGRTLRVIFGMDELREKLVAQDAALDDRALELLKVFVVYEHPFLLRRPRLRLVLDQVTEIDLQFAAGFEHDPRRFRAAMPRQLADEIASDPKKLESWVGKAHKENIFDEPDHWVNMWRWSPQPTALSRLQGFVAEVKANHPIDTNSAEFKQMLVGLPTGSHLPPWAKQDLRTLFEYAKTTNNQKLEDQLFEIRFGFELEDDWSQNSDLDDIDTLWQLLKDLPDSNVEGNTKIHELLLDEGNGGGMYSPNTHDISIGSTELANRERFEDVVRHEVGHAVHEMKDHLVNGWLGQRFGWRIFGTSDVEIDQWVILMGGWGTLTSAQQKDVRSALRTALGNGSSWNPGPTPSLPSGHPWYGPTFGPRLASEQTQANWYEHFRTWYRSNNHAFFLNYWYKTFLAVDVAALDLVEQMPSSYASMSHYEFFAELYALYYDLDDPKRPAIPQDVAQWLDGNIGAPEANAPAMPQMSPKREWETVGRPGKKPETDKRARKKKTTAQA
jgi:CpXC motif protein